MAANRVDSACRLDPIFTLNRLKDSLTNFEDFIIEVS